MSRLLDCQCDKPSPGGLTKEPCTRKATEEDLLCDACRNGCHRLSVGPADKPEEMKLIDPHAQVFLHAAWDNL